MASFPQLPEIIDLVMKRLSCIGDIYSCGAVCKSWRSVAAAFRKAQNPCLTPWLMLTNDDTDAQNIRTFFSLSSKRNFTISLPGIHGRRCWGSPFGWLVTMGLDLDIHLLNPLSGVQLPLLPQTTFGDQYTRNEPPEIVRWCFTRRFVLSSNPSDPSSSVVIAIYSENEKLAFARAGDKSWTPIKSLHRKIRPQYQDAIFFNGHFYATNNNGVLVVCDINNTHPTAKLIASSPDGYRRYRRFYLVEMSGELHLVAQNMKTVEDSDSEFHYETKCFLVHKFDFQTKNWVEVFDLGDNALFVGSNTSFGVSTYAHPELKRNAIYYTDAHNINFKSKKENDMGVYDYEEQTSTQIYSGPHVFSTFSRPLFIVPGL